MKVYRIAFLFFLLTDAVFAQEPDWINYVIKNDKNLVVVSVDLQFDLYHPNYKYLVLVGSEERRHCLKNGFPDPDGIAEADLFSDTIDSVIRNTTAYKKVGMITYSCRIFDLFYVKDTANLKNKLTESLGKKFRDKKNSIGIEKDRKWKFYYTKLFPADFTEDFVFDHQILFQLVSNGDMLKKKRDVRYWIYFKKPKNRQEFAYKVKKLDYKIDSLSYKKELHYPYELIIRKDEFVDPELVKARSTIFQLLLEKYHGINDRWDTQLIID